MDIFKIIKDSFNIFIKEKNVPSMLSASVVSYSAPDAVVLLVGSSVNITIRNLSGVVLSPSDKVMVVIPSGNYTNAFVGWKI